MNMAVMGSLSSRLILRLLYYLLQTNVSLAYSLKNCNIGYLETPSADVSIDCAWRMLTTVPNHLPRDAVSIQLEENQLKKIDKENFYGMSKLRNLNLGSNKLTYVEDGSFSSLVSLKKLSLKDNQLTNLTNATFQGLSNLIELDLSINRIRFIHDSVFNSLTSLQTLDLGLNSLQQVTDMKPVLQLPHIQKLGLDCNEFSSFQTKDLQLNQSSSLKELSISCFNKAHFSITTPIFPHLEKIELPGCGQRYNLEWDVQDKTLLRNITKLYVNGFGLSFEGMHSVLQSLDSLRYLKLSPSDEWFGKGVLSTVCKVATLRNLDLFSNILTNLTSTLAPCSQLTELDLSETWITELAKGAIQQMNQLRSLNLNVNKLTKVPSEIKGLRFLEILRMNFNFISELSCEDFANTRRLQELSLNSNRIVYLDGCVVEHLTDLKLLDLGGNQLLDYRDSFTFPLYQLEVLDVCSYSMLEVEVGDFQGLESLKQLKVASYFTGSTHRRTIQRLNMDTGNASHSLDSLQNLEYLAVDLYCDSDLNFLQETNNEDALNFESLKTFTVICKSGYKGFHSEVPRIMLEAMENLENFKAVNNYDVAPDLGTFNFNNQLKNLTLNKIDLTDLDPQIFLSVPKLQILDFSETKIKSLDFLVQANLTKLRYLKLTDNEISVINETVFSFLPSLTYLDLSNNPFSCECSNSGFIQWVNDNKQTQVVNTDQYKCSLPVDKLGTALLDFDIQPCLDDGSFFFFISSTCLVVLTLLTSFIYHFLKWQLVYTFHLFLAFLYDGWKGKKQDPHQFDAFVSYNVHDEDWIYKEMLPVLEGEQGWRICLHHRDFQPGKPIIENITDAIYGSRKTICVISRHYLQSEWCSREIQIASFRLFDEQKDVLILLFLEEIPRHHLAPHYRMRKLLKKRTYLSWPQAAHPGVFWQNVQRALQTGDAVAENTDLLTGT
uniref:Chromosome undetermined SCAF11492, whole genome shotgun sequence, Uncharacterized protein n=1 Tax=Nothobranchius kuhntae TaxID=321403 RepID=A0A1A8I4Z0_NOTKU